MSTRLSYLCNLEGNKRPRVDVEVLVRNPVGYYDHVRAVRGVHEFSLHVDVNARLVYVSYPAPWGSSSHRCQTLVGTDPRFITTDGELPQ